MFEDLGMDDDGSQAKSGETIPLPNVSGALFKKVLVWCEYHKDDPIVLDDDEGTEKKDLTCEDVHEWDANFLKVLLNI